MTYQPHPVDTEHLELPAELAPLMEAIARNTHENWAMERIRLGWTWGPERNDEKKQHPCLVPYEELPESEKDFDRRTSTQSLKVILAHGFRITK